MKRNEKRNPYSIVNRSHQYRFLVTILIYNLIIAGLLAAFLFVPDIIRMNDETLSTSARAIAAEKILTLHSRVWPVIIALICLFGLHSVRLFHQFIGPLFKFTMAFKEVKEGNLGRRIKLRKRDNLHKEAAIFNEMLDAVSEKIAVIQAAGQDSLDLLEKAESFAKKTGVQGEPVLKNIEGLRKNLEDIAASAGYFRTK